MNNKAGSFYSATAEKQSNNGRDFDFNNEGNTNILKIDMDIPHFPSVVLIKENNQNQN